MISPIQKQLRSPLIGEQIKKKSCCPSTDGILFGNKKKCNTQPQKHINESVIRIAG